MRKDIDTEVGRLAVFDDGTGPATFFWPSLYLDHASLSSLENELVSDRRCIVVDGPGHGESPGAGRLYDLAACARAAFQVLDALGVSTVDWVGSAWGGHVGVLAAIQCPKRITSLAVIGSPMQPLSDEVRWKTRWLLLPLLKLGMAGIAGGLLAKALVSPAADQRLHDEVRAAVRRAPALAEAVRSISLGRGDLVPELSRIACPTLVVVGGDDAMWPLEIAAAQAARIPRSRVETVTGAGHAVPLERPRETAALLRAHWKS
jgi:pimeloyl-ACP methyl ester carboxylesterase